MTIGQIHHYAESLAQQYNPDALTPFPFEKIQAEKKDLEIVFSNLSEVSFLGTVGYLPTEEKCKIFISSRLSLKSQNLLIAHELGHYFLHQEILRKPDAFIDGEVLLEGSIAPLSTGKESIFDIEANNFALALLMPKEIVLQVWESLRNVQECAKVFQVPVFAAAIRLEQIGVVL